MNQFKQFLMFYSTQIIGYIRGKEGRWYKNELLIP